MGQSLGLEIEDDFSTFPGHRKAHAVFEALDGQTMGQYLVNIDEVLFQQGVHGVPC